MATLTRPSRANGHVAKKRKVADVTATTRPIETNDFAPPKPLHINNNPERVLFA